MEYIRSKPYNKWEFKIKWPEPEDESQSSRRSRERRETRSASEDASEGTKHTDAAGAGAGAGGPLALPSGSRPHGGREPLAVGSAQKPVTAGAIGAAPSRREPVAALPAGSRPHEGAPAPRLSGSLQRGRAEIGGGALTSEQHFEQFPMRHTVPGMGELVREAMAQKAGARPGAGHTGDTGEIVGWATGYGPEHQKSSKVSDSSIWDAEIVGENPKDYEKGHTGEIRAIGTTPEKAATQPVPKVSPRQFEPVRAGDTREIPVARPHGSREASPLAAARRPSAPLAAAQHTPRLAIGPGPNVRLPSMKPGEALGALAQGQPGRQFQQFGGHTVPILGSESKTPGGGLFIPRRYR